MQPWLSYIVRSHPATAEISSMSSSMEEGQKLSLNLSKMEVIVNGRQKQGENFATPVKFP